MNMDHGQTHHSTTSGKRLSWTIAFNVVITAAEIVGGLLTGYLALLADAVHNLSDVAALILAWFGVKGAQRPASKRSTYGWQRLEVIMALISAVALIAAAGFIVIEAYHRLVEPQLINRPGIFMTIAVIGLLGNILSVWLLESERSKSLNMKTAFLHMTFDAASSVAVIAGGLLIIFKDWYIVDPILSLLIAVIILISTYRVIREAVLILMEAVPDRIDFDEVHGAIGELEGVCNVHHLHIWSLSSTEVALSCHVSVPGDDPVDNSIIIEKIDGMLKQRFDIGHTTIQVEQAGLHSDDPVCRGRRRGDHDENR